MVSVQCTPYKQALESTDGSLDAAPLEEVLEFMQHLEVRPRRGGWSRAVVTISRMILSSHETEGDPRTTLPQVPVFSSHVASQQCAEGGAHQESPRGTQ